MSTPERYQQKQGQQQIGKYVDQTGDWLAYLPWAIRNEKERVSHEGDRIQEISLRIGPQVLKRKTRGQIRRVKTRGGELILKSKLAPRTEADMIV